MFVDTKKVFANIFYFIIKKKGGEKMRGRPKGGTNKYWSSQEKYETIKPVLKGEISGEDQARKIGFKSSGIISTWIKRYKKDGLKGLENKRKPGNHLARFSSKKELTELEKLQYENLLLRIENERLKKGYTSEEADLAKRKK